ncbi:MAG: hypothetical protein IKL65_02195 [Bacilli bacterium]|nr:hypothetical protein [Bacilli bacterium]
MDELFNNINKNIEELSSQPSSKKRFKLKKSKKRTVTIYSKPQVNHIKLNKEDIDKIKKQPLGNELIKFRKKLYKIFKSENLNLLNNNIKSLKVKIKYIAPEILLLKFVSGKYLFQKNKIEIIKYFKEGTTKHEFFHMASTFYHKEAMLAFSGFEQINYLKKEIVGLGLNEGYTELLTDRYFNEQAEYVSYSYDVCKFFAEKLEEIVGKKEMEKFYLNADLLGLCKYLTNFDELEHIMSFIVYLDYLVKHASLHNPKKFKNCYELIECYLAKWYISKKQQELDKNIIDKETFDIEIKNYVNSLGNKDLYIENYVKQKEYSLK